MATARVFQDLIAGVTDADPGAAGVTLSGPFLAALQVVASPEYIALTLDPEAVFGDPEVVHVTVHTSAATTATIERGKEGTSGIAHAIGTKAIAAPTTAGLAGLMPVGAIAMYGGAAAPDSYLLCQGQSLDTTAYAALFAAIAYAYGGSGANFNIPDMQQRFPLGLATSGTGSSLGESGGDIDHVHTGLGHVHGQGSHTHTTSNTGSTDPGDTNAKDPGDTNTAGSHNHTRTGDAVWGGGGNLFNEHSGNQRAHDHTIPTQSAHSHTMPTHTHTMPSHTHTNPSTGSTDPGNTDSTTPTTSAENPPYMTVNYIIKVV